MPLALFALVIFQIGSYIYAQAGLDCNPPIYTSYMAEMTKACHYAQFFISCGGSLVKFLPRLTSNYDPPHPISQVAKITGASH
jgi:hypothetical protein